MSLDLIGFICALVLALLVLIWIAYCMFIRERHKSEYFHHNINDIQYKNNVLRLHNEAAFEKKEAPKSTTAVGVFVLPSKHKQQESHFAPRPDYPESGPRITKSTDQLIDILDDVDTGYRDGICEVDSHKCPRDDD